MISFFENNTNYIFIDNFNENLKNIYKNLNILKKDGNPFKYISIYDFNNNKLSGKKIIKKNNNEIIILPKTLKTNIHKIDDFKDSLFSFTKNFIIKINDNYLNNVIVDDNYLYDNDSNKKYIIKIKNNSDNPDLKILYILKKDNSNILLPLFEKFFTLCKLANTNTKRFIGYVNLNNYLQFLKYPSSINFINTENTILLEQNLLFSAEYVKNNKLVINVYGASLLNDSVEKSPFILLTTTPTKVQLETLPFFKIRYKNLDIFVSSVIFDKINFIKQMKGAFNILSTF